MFQEHNCPNGGSTNLVKNGATYYPKARAGRAYSLEAICQVLAIKPYKLYAYRDEL